MYKAGFIGTGNMGSALALAAAKKIGGEKILIADHHRGKTDALVNQTGCRVTEDIKDMAVSAEYIFLAVKPNVIRNVAKELAEPLLKEKAAGNSHVVVTIAAGISADTISSCIQNACPVLRIMPNTPAAIGKGMTLIAESELISEEILDDFQNMMAESGSFEMVSEEKFDITSGVSGCTPAYAYMFIESLADGAVQTGVPRAQALRLAAQTVAGAAAMILESGKHPDQLKDEVCSPGGSTIEGVEALEKYGFRYAVAQSIVKSTEKNRLLGK